MIDMKPQVAQTWIALKGSEPQPTEKTTQNKAKQPNLIMKNFKQMSLRIYHIEAPMALAAEPSSP